jgi:hypothetical protein
MNNDIITWLESPDGNEWRKNHFKVVFGIIASIKLDIECNPELANLCHWSGAWRQARNHIDRQYVNMRVDRLLGLEYCDYPIITREKHMTSSSINHERQLLLAALDSIKACDDREIELLHELKEIRARREVFDGSVQRIMVNYEESQLPSSNWHELLDGIHHRIAVVLTRHSFRGI